MLKASFVLVVSVAIATLVPISLAISGIGSPVQSSLGFYSGGDSVIRDPRGDAQPVLQESDALIIPEVEAYHDVTGASVRKHDGAFMLSLELAGNPDLNEKYETSYMWHIISSDAATGRDLHYIVMIFHFGPDFNHTSVGWHYAVYNDTSESYILPQTKIDDMPEGKVEYPVQDWLIGNPSSFRYWVSVFVRVDSTSFDGPPEYLMDYAPLVLF
jgi:hypothetical protein